MKYVCLLRGINVGGNRKVSMVELRAVFEDIGYEDVASYINSGNIVFSAKTKPSVVVIEKTLMVTFGFEIPVLVLDGEHVRAIAEAIPKSWQNDTSQRSDVLYLLPDIDKPEIIDSIGHRPEIETMMYVPGAVLCMIGRTNQSRGSLLKLMGTPLYKRMTIRNINTARKLAELCA